MWDAMMQNIYEQRRRIAADFAEADDPAPEE